MPKSDGADKATGTDVEAGAGEVLVRVNPDVWQTNYVEHGDYRIGSEPVAVPSSVFTKELKKLTVTRLNNDNEQEEVPLVVEA